jgi:hypothetical protein
MWRDIEKRSFPPPAVVRPVPWVRRVLPLAAMLVLGFGLGQFTPLLRSRSSPAAADALAANAAPDGAAQAAGTGDAFFVGVATNYLERVTALLVSLAEANRQGIPLDYSTTQARDLLATTRLLMDSPQPQSAALRALLDDLELVLAQMVRLPGRAAPPDVYLIDQTIDQREVLPRLRGLLAENTTSQP